MTCIRVYVLPLHRLAPKQTKHKVHWRHVTQRRRERAVIGHRFETRWILLGVCRSPVTLNLL